MIANSPNGLQFKLNTNDYTAALVSCKAKGDIFIPRFFEHESKKYRIITLEFNSFAYQTINSVSFPEDSEVISFKKSSFYLAHVKKLQIPASLKQLEDGWCDKLKDLIDIKVSKKNKMFSVIDNKYLVSKMKPDDKTFSILHYALFDIKDANIPPEIKILKSSSFHDHSNLHSIIFSENSELRCIEDSAFSITPIEKLVLPEKVETIGSTFFSVKNLVKVEISPKNKYFKMVDGKYLLKKSNVSNSFYDIFVFAARNIESVKIPSEIKVISKHAFNFCGRLKTISFDSSSMLEKIESSAFSSINGPTNLTIPSVKIVCEEAIERIGTLLSIQFFSKSISLYRSAISECNNLAAISFPNATMINLAADSMKNIPKETRIEIRQDSEQKGHGFDSCKNQIKFIRVRHKKDEKTKDEKTKDDKTKDEKAKDVKTKDDKTKDVKTKDDKTKDIKIKDDKNKETISHENEIQLKHIHFLEKRLSQYEKVVPFSSKNASNIGTIDYEVETETILNKESKTNIYIDENDESHHKILTKIGEGASSVAFKIIDERTSKVMCKKVLKFNETNASESFKNAKNVLKEFEVLCNINHPCICKAIGINVQEKVESSNSSIDTSSKQLTTIALFLEYHPYNLKRWLENNFFNNTMKTKIALEVAFGMSHIHSLGMIHRDLKIENIMLSYVYEAKIIDFELVHVNDLLGSSKSLTKGIGTLAYMSPEMQNEEEYSNKTDVYSFGVVLFFLFFGKLPKQTMKDKLTNKPLIFPQPSDSASKFCIDLIKKCMMFEPQKRPSFDEIIEDMKSHSFQLANEIDVEDVQRRYRSLFRYKNQNEQKEKDKKK